MVQTNTNTHDFPADSISNTQTNQSNNQSINQTFCVLFVLFFLIYFDCLMTHLSLFYGHLNVKLQNIKCIFKLRMYITHDLVRYLRLNEQISAILHGL